MHVQNTTVGFIAYSDQRYIILKLWTEYKQEVILISKVNCVYGSPGGCII